MGAPAPTATGGQSLLPITLDVIAALVLVLRKLADEFLRLRPFAVAGRGIEMADVAQIDERLPQAWASASMRS